MTETILSNPLLSVIDSSKLKAYHSCPRKFFFSYVLGWRPAAPSHDLIFGQAMHEALEYIYTIHKEQGVEVAYTQRVALKAYEKFLEIYRNHYPEETDSEVGAKNPNNLLSAILDYMTFYKPVDKFKINYVEVSGMVPIGETSTGERSIFFRLDTVGETAKGENFVLEHKSSKWSTQRWAASFSHAIQIGTCLHALNCLYEGTNKVLLNGIFFRPEPRYKKNGELCANSSKGNEFFRPEFQWSLARLCNWLYTVNYYFDRIEADYEALTSTKMIDAPAMEAFPINPSACFEYNRECPYMSYCTSWPNPLQHCRVCPSEFKVEHWDPRAGDKSNQEGAENAN